MILAILLLAAATPEATRAFQKCVSCHAIDPAETDLPGPNLHGVLGRRAATAPDYAYSEALQNAGSSGLVWTRENLDKFLTEPESLVPGTMMSTPPQTTPQERALLYDLFRAPN